MPDAKGLVKQAVQAYKANQKATAKELLLKAVDMDEHNEQAWMWMSAVVDSLEEQQICLENVLSINPNNERAQKGLAVINQKLGKSGASAPAQSNPLAGTGFEANPFSPADTGSGSSVDWERTGPSVHGSGQNVEMPSEQQYDDWLNGMGLNNTNASASPPP
ncbi:MAG: tetratricopeptide repeat protein, partial [Anaerolineales bacterium]